MKVSVKIIRYTVVMILIKENFIKDKMLVEVEGNKIIYLLLY